MAAAVGLTTGADDGMAAAVGLATGAGEDAPRPLEPLFLRMEPCLLKARAVFL